MKCAVVLAAGQSRRMGTQKLLLPYAGQTVIGHVVDTVLASTLDAVYVVVGRDADRIAAALADRPITLVNNPAGESDMLASVRCGLAALPEACEAALLVLGDQPAIQAEWIDEMAHRFDQTTSGIVVPTFQGRRGHPLLLAMRYRNEILTRYDDVGLRGLLWAHGDDVLPWPAPTREILADMDLPEDYRRELAARRLRET